MNTDSSASINQSHSRKTNDTMEMGSNAFSRNLPMARTGSGTSWQPDASPLFMNMFHKSGWMFMLHYSAFLNYTTQNILRNRNQRGDNQIAIPNWIMGMALRPIGKNDLFMSRIMLSSDALLMGGEGYPLLLQTGETWKDSLLIDRQHPHELFSELSLGYTHGFSKKSDIFIYLGFPGEPAIGPPAFMHRPSASNIPFSPLGHHWQDATHIVFGVGTLGFRYNKWKLESSAFNGSEPNENRYNFDTPKLNSYSFRLSFNPSKSLAIQSSYAFLKNPEKHEPHQSIERFSSSILHSYSFGKNVISTSLIWGMNKSINKEESIIHYSNSFLLESYLLTNRYSIFGRLEVIQKSFHELSIPSSSTSNWIKFISIGASRFLIKGSNIWLDLGGMAGVYFINPELQKVYGSYPLSANLFLRIIPSKLI